MKITKILIHTGQPGPPTADGKLYATDTPGLGVTPDFEALGTPVATYMLS